MKIKKITFKSPVGRLRSHYTEWEKIGSGKTILDVIKVGYKLLFKTDPTSIELNSNRSARDESEFVTGEIKKINRKRMCVTGIQKKNTPK